MPQHDEHLASRVHIITLIMAIIGGLAFLFKSIDDIKLTFVACFFFILGTCYLVIRWDYGPFGTLEHQEQKHRQSLNLAHLMLILCVVIPFVLSCAASLIMQNTPKWVEEYVISVATGKIKGNWNLMQVTVSNDPQVSDAKSLIGALSSKTSGSAAPLFPVVTGSAAPLFPVVNSLLEKGIDIVSNILSVFCIISLLIGFFLLLIERFARVIT